jgi:hypothetical protein
VQAEWERRTLMRVGYSPVGLHLYVLVARLTDLEQACLWPDRWPSDIRTMRAAHEHIIANWATLKSGDVVDVEHLLGETREKKLTEIEPCP